MYAEFHDTPILKTGEIRADRQTNIQIDKMAMCLIRIDRSRAPFAQPLLGPKLPVEDLGSGSGKFISIPIFWSSLATIS